MTKATQPPEAQSLPRHKRVVRAGVRSITVLVILFAVLVGGISYMMGKPITAPDWVQTRIEARLATELPQARVTFGEMVFVLDDGWRPRVRLRNVAIKTPDGTEIVAFNEVKSSFAMRPLLKGQIQPRNLDLSGVFASLERGLDGNVTLRGGVGVGGPTRQAATVPLLIGQVDTILQSPALRTLRNVSLRALTLRYEDQRTKRAWTIDGGRVLLARSRQNLNMSADLAVLGGGADVATLSANYDSVIGQTAANFGVVIDGVSARDIAAQSPAFAWMSVLRAPISGAVRSGLTASGTLKPINATLQIGAGVVQPNKQTEPIPFDGARSYFNYDPQAQVLLFDELSVQSAWVSGQLSGEAALNGVKEGKLNDIVAQFQLRNLVANPGTFYPEPVAISEASIDMQISLNPFVLKIGQLQVSDLGKTLVLDGTLRAEAAGWNAAVNGQMDGITPERLLALWPEAVKPKTRNWLVENVIAAKLSNIDLAFRRIPDTPPQTYLAFDYEAAEVRFLRSMPNITNGRGHASLLENRLVVSLDEGTVTAPDGGDVTVRASSFIMPDVRVKDGPPAIVRFATTSDIKPALSLLDQPPLEVMTRTKLPITIAQGKVALEGTLAFPLKKGGGLAAVEYHVAGKLQQVRSDSLVKGRLIEADELALVANNREVRIGGKGRFDGVGFDGTWVQPIGPGSDKSRLTGRVDLTPEGLKTFSIALPPGTISGSGKGQIALELARGKRPAYSLSSDLRGLRVQVPQLSWVKSPKASGQLRVSGTLGKTPTVDVLRIEGAGLSAQGNVTLRPSGGLDRVRFERLAVGNWLNIPVDLVGNGPGKPLQLVIRGGSLDLRRAQFGAGGGGGGGGASQPGPPMLVSLDRLQITDTFALTGMTGRFTTGGGLSGPFQALLNGGTPVQGTVTPQGGRSAVRLTSSDAGGVLRSADLIKQVVGGALDLTLLPVGRGGAFDGRLRIKNVTIKDAPGIAALVNAISVVGLINELNGDGIYFDDVEAEFRLTPDQLTLTKSSAVGNSLGVSMDGIFGLQSGQIDMQGVVTPVYLLNGIGSVLTRKGEGLIGMNYTLSGAAKSPSVSVNPLSALTPGMFREIFRKPAPKLPEVDGVANSTLPPVAPETQKRVVPEYTGR